MITFKDFCVNLASTESVDLPDDTRPEIDDSRIEENALRVIATLNSHMHELDAVMIPDIQDAFSDMNAVDRKFEAFGDEIPNELLEYLAVNIYGTHYNNLKSDERAIIDISAMYCCISVTDNDDSDDIDDDVVETSFDDDDSDEIEESESDNEVSEETDTVVDESPKSSIVGDVFANITNNEMEDHIMSSVTLKKLPVDHFQASSSDVVAHLQEKLGFAFDFDFAIWDNRAEWEKPLATEKCYVIMRAVFRPEDIQIQTASNDYVDVVLKKTSAGIQFKDDVMAILEPFMFPTDIAEQIKDPVRMQAYATMGIVGNRLEELIRRPRLFYDQVNNRFGIYLRPEAIISDIINDMSIKETGEPFKGTIGFGCVYGDNGNAAAITWGINAYKSFRMTPSGISIDAVFNGVRK